MPAGMQCWDASGNLSFDRTTPVVKFTGSFSVGTSHTGTATSGSVYAPEFATTSHVGFFVRSDGGWSNDETDAVVYISGNYLYWSFPTTYLPNATYTYGIR